jgi:hypothetical protein
MRLAEGSRFCTSLGNALQETGCSSVCKTIPRDRMSKQSGELIRPRTTAGLRNSRRGVTRTRVGRFSYNTRMRHVERTANSVQTSIHSTSLTRRLGLPSSTVRLPRFDTPTSTHSQSCPCNPPVLFRYPSGTKLHSRLVSP